MRQDLLKIISAAKDVTNAIILTHNIDFVFVESVVIPALRKCGSPSVSIFADADCAAQAYQYQARVLAGLGRRYRVVPVAMRTGWRFHPKALLLAGPESATLLVGSGNLTFGGWRENGEIWFRYDSAEDGTRVFSAFRAYLHEVLGMCPGSETLSPEVEEAFDSSTRRWAEGMDEPGGLLGRVGRGERLLQELVSVLGAGEVDELYVCAPYFDEDGEALRSLWRQLGSPRTRVLVQSERTNLPKAAAADLDSSIVLRAATYRHRLVGGGDGEERVREAVLHAKFYAARRGDVVTVVAGSANCSRAALTVGGPVGNAELMARTTVAAAEFEKAFLGELIVGETEPVLGAAANDDGVVPAAGGFIRVRAARVEGGALWVAFEADETTRVKSAEVDGKVVRREAGGDGWTKFKASGYGRMVVVVGDGQEAEVRSQLHWIDDETALGASARGRTLADAIQSRVRDDTWSVGAWTEVLAELLKHLQYMPKIASVHGTGGEVEGRNGEEGVHFDWGDVFAEGYGLPTEASLMRRLSIGVDDRVGGLRSMLTRWFGLVRPERESGAASGEEDPGVSEEVRSDDAGDGVDRMEALPKAAGGGLRRATSSAERTRALRVVRQVAARLGEAEFLSDRRPEVLAADLRIAAVLLRVGLSEHWLTEDEFVDGTMEIWMPLFFNAVSSENAGWLERRYLTAADPGEFAKAVGSVELAAALGCWALSVPVRAGSAKHTRLELASALGVARLPWLWGIGDEERVAGEMAEMVSCTSGRDGGDWREFQRRWSALVVRGYALSRLERAILGVEMSELRGRITQVRVETGELLWQRGAGFCVAAEDCERVEGRKARVLVLQRGGGSKIYTGPFLMPLAGLLEENVLDDSRMPSIARRELVAMIRDLRLGLSV